MSKVSQSELQALVVLLLALLMATYCYFHWRDQQEDKKMLQGVIQQLESSLIASQSLDQRQKQLLQVLNSTQHWPLIESYTPEFWLSELQGVISRNQALKGFSARLLVDKQDVLGDHNGQELFVTPIDFELRVADPMQALNIIKVFDQSLGSYSSVESCRLQRQETLSEQTIFRLQCRIRKIAYREVNL